MLIQRKLWFPENFIDVIHIFGISRPQIRRRKSACGFDKRPENRVPDPQLEHQFKGRKTRRMVVLEVARSRSTWQISYPPYYITTHTWAK